MHKMQWDLLGLRLMRPDIGWNVYMQLVTLHNIYACLFGGRCGLLVVHVHKYLQYLERLGTSGEWLFGQHVNEKQQENNLTGALKMYSTGAKYSHYHFICRDKKQAMHWGIRWLSYKPT